VPAVKTGALLFVAGHDPERDGRLVYHGRVGQSVAIGDARAALRLATANALASARAGGRSLERLRCVVLIAFVSAAAPDGLDPKILTGSLALLASALPEGDRPVVWLRATQSLAGGMPVEVELVLESGRRRARESLALRRRLRKPGPAAARAPRRSAARTS